MLVSIIILSYNTRDLISQCLTSIEEYFDKSEVETIVVDNNSHDDSVSFIKKNYKYIKLIENTENAGFAKGVNIGAHEAQGEYLFFLNSDALLQETTIEALIKAFSDEKTGIVGGLLKNTDGSIQRSYGKFYDLLPAAKLLFGGDTVELIGHTTSAPRTVDWVSGGCMMIKKSVFEQVKGFDEHFFMYIEDMELCKRVNDAGYRVVFQPLAVVTHVGHASSSRAFAIQNIYKGLVYYYEKHKSYTARILLKTLLMSKAYISIVLGTIFRRKSLVSTYSSALKSL